MEEKMLNNSVILPEISPFSFEFGAMDCGANTDIFPDGSLLKYLPEFETQSFTYGDDWGCVNHSLENGLEAIIIKQLSTYSPENQTWLKDNIYKNDKPNFSDRDLVVLSGTKVGVGNSGASVLATAQTKGLIAQTLEDWDAYSRDPSMTIEKYYAYARTPEDEKKAKEWNDRFEITGEWVSRNNLAEASKKGAIQVYVYAWAKDSNGNYYNPKGSYNHAVLLADYKTTQIYDTYQPELKTLDSWDSIYVWALKLNIKEKVMTKPNFANNSLVMLVEGTGSIGLYLDGKIIVDDAAKILTVFMARNVKDNKFTGGSVYSVKLADWNKFEKYNLKMEKIA